MGKIKRKVEIFASDGISMTAEEIMQATVQMPANLKPRALVKMNGEIKSLRFEAEVIPDAGR